MSLVNKYASRLGGASTHDGSSEATAWTLSEAIAAVNALAAGGAAGWVINYKGDGTADARAATDTISIGGTATSPLVIRGYKTTIGDGYQGRGNGGTGALVATNMPAIAYTSTARLNISANWVVVDALSISNVANSAVINLGTGTVRGCAVGNNNSGGSAAGVAMAGPGSVEDCDVTLSGGSGGNAAISMGTTLARVTGNRITAPGMVGVKIGSGGNSATGNQIFGCGTGISVTGSGTSTEISGNTIAGNTTGISIVSGNTATQRIANNLITDNTTGLTTNGAAVVGSGNRFDRNTTNTDANDWLDVTGWGRNTTSVTQAQEYQSYASNDFRLASTSPAIGNGQFGRDIGAVKYAGGGGSAGGVSLARVMGGL